MVGNWSKARVQFPLQGDRQMRQLGWHQPLICMCLPALCVCVCVGAGVWGQDQMGPLFRESTTSGADGHNAPFHGVGVGSSGGEHPEEGGIHSARGIAKDLLEEDPGQCRVLRMSR